MADDKLKAGPESPGEGSVGDAQTVTKPPVPETVEEPAAGTGPVRQPEQSVTPGMGGDVPAQPAPQVEADKVEKSPDQDKKVEPEEKTAKRRGRPPKEQDSPQGDKPEKGPEPRTGRPAKADKAARGKSPSPALDKVSRGKEQELTPAQRGGKTRRERNQNVKDFLAGKRETPFADGKQPPKSTKGAPVKEAEAPAPEIKLPPTPEVPPRPVEQGKIVYLKLSELHPFHTLRDHPFKVQDDKAMDDLVGTIKEHGIMTPATVRPEKDGKGYEIIAGHRRCHGGERAGLDEIPCIVREMTDLEAVREMKNSNKQRGDPLPSELAKLLDLELEAIKRQGARPKNDKEAEALGKLSVEIVGKEHDMNYKKVLRYYGMNALSHNVIMADRKKLKSANGLYLGSTGSGKSFAAKRELLNVFLTIPQDRILIVDPMGEYAPLVRRLGGQVIEIAPGSPNHINPMDIRLDIDEDESPLSMKADFLLSLCELVVGGKDGLQPIEKTVIDRCVRLIYRDMALGIGDGKPPLLQDLYEELLKQPEPEARRVATALELYCTGSLNLFNHPTNVDLTARVVCIVLKGLGENLRKIAMHITNDFVTSAVNVNFHNGISTWCYFDEFHILLRDALTASYFVAVWKMLRKKGCVPSALTQNVKDLLASREIEAILDNTDFMILLAQAQSDRAILAKQLGISEHQLSYITHSNSGEGLLFYGDVTIPFVDRFPKGEIYNLLTTRPEDLKNEAKTEQAKTRAKGTPLLLGERRRSWRGRWGRLPR